jgi:multicomponent Na+:H+ antiporter subunit G
MDILDSAGSWIADALVVLGVVVMTLVVYGLYRMPDLYTRLHAASKAVFLGAIALAAASVVTGQREIILRVVLISLFLILTTPIASHVIGKAAFESDEERWSNAHPQSPGSGDATESPARVNQE